MLPFFSNKNRETKSIVLDIQSGLVRGALVEHLEDGQKNITSVITRSISSKTHIMNAEHLTKRVLKLISEVVEQITKETGNHKISKIDYILSSPWIFNELKTSIVKYDKETSISSKTVSDLIEAQQKKDSNNTDIIQIEQKIFDIKLNGYTATTFDGKSVHSLEISFSKSYSSKVFLDKVYSTVDKYIHSKKHTLNSALFLQYTAMRELISDKSEYIYIHIHDELTDVVIVKDGLCKHMASFPFGIQTLLRKISSSTKNSIEMSDSILSLYQGKKLDGAEQVKIEKIIKSLLQAWSNLFTQSFEKTFEVTSVPRTVYLSSHSHFDIFKEALIYQNEFNFNIVPYDSVDAGNSITFKKGVDQSNMIKIYTLALEKII